MQEETIYQGMQALSSDPSLKILEYPSTFFLGTHMNVTKAPFVDKRVRQAMAFCLDRNALNQVLYNGKGVIANDTVFSPVFPNSPKIPARTQDYAKAKQLLADAGHPSGLTVTLAAYKNIEVPQYAQLIKAQCEPAGITVNIAMDSYDQYYSGNPAPWLSVPFGITEYAPRPTPGMIINFLLLPNAVWNSSHWNNAEFASLYNQYMATVDEAKGLELATKMATIQQDDTPELLTVWVTALRAMKKNVYGVRGPGSLFISLAETYKA
jgi:peptide/nickel transport system substrate-binding protein